MNDFVFCPKSIYFHGLYKNFSDIQYKAVPQKLGTMKHETIEKGSYSSKKSVLQGVSIFSEKYNLGGKIDIFNIRKSELVERKTKIKKIYDGYIYQLYAQYFCLEEMGYKVKKIFLYSLSDNKKYPIPLPGSKQRKEFEAILKKIRNFDMQDPDFNPNLEKCKMCIYSNLCDSCTT